MALDDKGNAITTPGDVQLALRDEKVQEAATSYNLPDPASLDATTPYGMAKEFTQKAIAEAYRVIQQQCVQFLLNELTTLAQKSGSSTFLELAVFLNETKNNGIIGPGVDKYFQGSCLVSLYRGMCLTAIKRFGDSFEIREYGGGKVKRWNLKSADDKGKPLFDSEDIDSPEAYEKLDVNLQDGYMYPDSDKDASGCPLQVARVSFTYNYPLWIGFAQYGYLSTNRTTTDSAWITVPIYNACAAPIEPGIAGEEESKVDPLEEPDKDMTAQKDLDSKDVELKDLLLDLFTNIHTVAKAIGIQPDCRSWTDGGPQWDEHTAKEAGTTPKPETAYIPLEYLTTDDMNSFYQIYNDEHRTNPGNLLEGDVYQECTKMQNGEGDRRLIDVLKVCQDDIDYRGKVKGWIQQEVDWINARIASNLKTISSLQSQIKQNAKQKPPMDSSALQTQINTLLNENAGLANNRDNYWTPRYTNQTALATGDVAMHDEKTNKMHQVTEALAAHYKQEAVIKNKANETLDGAGSLLGL